MARYLLCVEIRPLADGVWEYEGRRATFEGEVEITLRHPNPLAPMEPQRFRLPMVFTQHVPPVYTYRHGSPPPHPRHVRFQRRIASSPRVPYTTGRAYRESFSRLRSRPSAIRDFPEGCGPSVSARRDEGSRAGEEDLVEGEDPDEPASSGDVRGSGDTGGMR